MAGAHKRLPTAEWWDVGSDGSREVGTRHGDFFMGQKASLSLPPHKIVPAKSTTCVGGQGREEIAASLGEFSLCFAPWPANPPVKHPGGWRRSGGDAAAKLGESTPFLAPWPAGAPLGNVWPIFGVEEAILQPNLGSHPQ